MSRTSQCDRVLGWFTCHDELSSQEAWTELGISHLASRITDLVHAGYDINKRTQNGKNKFGEPVRWTVYSLEKGQSNG